MLRLRNKSGCGSVWLERCVRDAEAGGSNPLTPTIFLLFSKAKKWSMKPVKASLHAPKVRFMLCGEAAKRFMARSAASFSVFSP